TSEPTSKPYFVTRADFLEKGGDYIKVDDGAFVSRLSKILTGFRNTVMEIALLQHSETEIEKMMAIQPPAIISMDLPGYPFHTSRSVTRTGKVRTVKPLPSTGM